MEERELRDRETIFAQVEDPRIERTRLHRLRDIIIIAICGVICGADGWVGIVRIWESEARLAHRSAQAAQRDSLP